MIINLGDAPFKAFVKVTYPSGTCTCTMGDRSYSHSGGGTYTFTVNKKGTWTVKCTSSTGLVKTATANVTTMGQVVTVNISYVLNLYNFGDECTSVTGGWGTGGGATKNASHICIDTGPYTSNYNAAFANHAVDLSAYNKLYVNISGTCISGRMMCSTIGGNVGFDGQVAYVSIAGSGERTVSLNVSSLSSNYIRICASGDFGAGTSTYIYIRRVWLDV